ncbi:MAG: serine--tRNA ligase [Candidatus Levybacteria bacterium RIFCSPLOWO2_01_FULL_39_24]|nr:MAG: serine--tRNA ligase [Candidatus Levybacteria bacterium RIFCSPHIGHO2_01_FULL_40_16]OGH28601.1 MAG: serine--tRNA ligase [Candidatus Levybacteria bacterium RIFCSPHIGHO2_12_FULL_39_9]OGH45991.1 MAG: serine--tRNA ligase [Candidatus Levybacteria bacterium RIFCSPLOWO2_01_FULL_39_24]
MIDLNFLRNNPQLIQKAALDKNIDININHILEIDKKYKELSISVQKLREERNVLTEKIKRDPKQFDRKGAQSLKQKLEKEEKALSAVWEELKIELLKIPNVPAVNTPIGPNSKFDKEIRRWGKIPKFDFPIKNHIEIGKNLDILDFVAGAKVSGFRGYYLKNEGALLHWAVLNFAFAKMISHGFTPMVPPTLIHEFVLVGSGHFPFGKRDIYQIANPGKLESGEEIKNPIYLGGTSEPALLAYFADKILTEKELPIKICALTQCYRSEVGDYGKDVKGLYRIHEFTKVEQVVICRNDLKESEKLHQEMQSISEEILQELDLSYHVVQNSTGDMGAGKYKMFDIETWMPARNNYGETHSNSNLTDWQARRLNMKFKDRKGIVNYCYTLNNTVIASPRILIAILENYQKADGSVLIPKILQKYLNIEKITPSK